MPWCSICCWRSVCPSGDAAIEFDEMIIAISYRVINEIATFRVSNMLGSRLEIRVARGPSALRRIAWSRYTSGARTYHRRVNRMLEDRALAKGRVRQTPTAASVVINGHHRIATMTTASSRGAAHGTGG